MGKRLKTRTQNRGTSTTNYYQSSHIYYLHTAKALVKIRRGFSLEPLPSVKPGLIWWALRNADSPLRNA